MNILIGNLSITNYCMENVKHIKFRQDLIKDELVYEFVSIRVGDDLIESRNINQLEPGYSYIIEDHGKPVAYIYIGNIKDTKDIVELRYEY